MCYFLSDTVVTVIAAWQAGRMHVRILMPLISEAL